jgi:predicted kinase
MLGGRGGSGKSWVKGQVYDPEKAIVLDADEIKGMLPEYEGFNAAQVHEESSDILESIMTGAMSLGLNVVLDATMKTEKSALRKVERFKGSGYRIEAHYMHLPRQDAAKRAVARFMGKTKRYVPVNVVLGNVGNEATFEAVKKHADAWSFRDNNVAKGEEPKLISEYKG